MKRSFWLFNSLLFVLLSLITSAHSASVSGKDDRNSHCINWSGPNEQVLLAAGSSATSDPFKRAQALFKEKEYDDVIGLLSGPADAEPNNLKLNILLAKALTEKCFILKTKGDSSYKTLIKKPYQIGRRIHKIDETLSEPYYIVAKCLLVNDRIYRAIKTVKKALYFSPDNAEYLLVLGDACCRYSEHLEDPYQARRYLHAAQDAYQKAIKIRKDDKGLKAEIEKKIRELSEEVKTKKKREIGEL